MSYRQKHTLSVLFDTFARSDKLGILFKNFVSPHTGISWHFKAHSISGAARNDVNVRVENFLTCSLSFRREQVDARHVIESLLHGTADLLRACHRRSSIFRIEPGPSLFVSAGYDESMPHRHGVDIHESDHALLLCYDVRRRFFTDNVAERASHAA